MERGDFEIIAPPEHLRPFVRRYLYANRLVQSGLIIQPKPTGYAYFANFFGEQAGDMGSVNGRTFEFSSRFFFLGQTIGHDIAFRYARGLQFITGELTATGHHRLFGIPGRRLPGLVAPLQEVAPGIAPLARECFVRGAEAARRDHVAEANTFISRSAERARPADPVVEQAVASLEASNGTVRIAEVCDRLGVGRRELNRKFTGMVGVSPKLFAQIMQINWVVGLLYANDNARLAQLAQEAGFYDQAHFSRAMQRFFREGPREFLMSDHPAFRSFLAGSRNFGPTSPADD